jgi:hypothetical protein
MTHAEKRGLAVIGRELAIEALSELEHLKQFPHKLDDLPF